MSFGATNAEVADLAFLLCMEMEIQERHVCRGLIDIHIVSIACRLYDDIILTCELHHQHNRKPLASLFAVIQPLHRNLFAVWCSKALAVR